MENLNLTMEQISTLIHTISGVLVGVLVGFLSLDPYQISTVILVFMAVALYLATGQIFQRVFDLFSKKNEKGEQKYDFKWWISNSAMVYFGFWFLTWVVVYNKFLL